MLNAHVSSKYEMYMLDAKRMDRRRYDGTGENVMVMARKTQDKPGPTGPDERTGEDQTGQDGTGSDVSTRDCAARATGLAINKRRWCRSAEKITALKLCVAQKGPYEACLKVDKILHMHDTET